MRVYMDNSATSFPKPTAVSQAMIEYMEQMGSSVSRSTSSQASATGDKIFELREAIANFFGAGSSRDVVFTKNITEALNIVIHGLIHPGDPVLISSLEHNAVTRPLTAAGAKIIAIPVSKNGELDMKFFSEHIHSAKAVFCTHISNVSGDVMPIGEIAPVCRQYQVPFILDTAQSAGLLPIHMDELFIDCLCFTGHKALLGPTGTGGMILRPSFEKKIPPLLTGGTGSRSDEEVHPLSMPDKFEAGTPNIVGLIGLASSLDYICKKTVSRIFQEETSLGQEFFKMLSSLKGFDMIGSQDYSGKPPIFSLNFHDRDNAEVSYLLSQQYGIDNRCGLHCSPRAHQCYGTYPHGTVRLSLSHFTTRPELQYAFSALENILKNK